MCVFKLVFKTSTFVCTEPTRNFLYSKRLSPWTNQFTHSGDKNQYWILVSYPICSKQEITCLQSAPPVYCKLWSLLLLKPAATLHCYQHHEYPELKPRGFFSPFKLLTLFPLATSSTTHEKALPFTRMQFSVFAINAVPLCIILNNSNVFLAGFYLAVLTVIFIWLYTIRSMFTHFLVEYNAVTVGCLCS